MAKKQTSPAPPSEEPQVDPERRIVARFAVGPAEWGIQANGHLRPLRYGNIEPETKVRPRYGNTRPRGVVIALIQGYGMPRQVTAVVNWGKPTPRPDWSPAPGSHIAGPKDVIRQWPADQLEPAP